MHNHLNQQEGPDNTQDIDHEPKQRNLRMYDFRGRKQDDE